MKVRFKKLNEKAVMPTKAHVTDAGFDLYASEAVTIPANGRAIIPTDIAMEIPQGYFGMAVGRSGNTIKRGLVGQTGIIDSGYRNGIGIMAFNFTSEDIAIAQGERAGQIVLMPILECELEQADSLSGSERGEGGYGSTGV
jgi:dUTP pyrophosphatase